MASAKEKFIEIIAPLAQEFERLTGIPASLTIAQAGLETGWNLEAPGNNLFGIKAGSSWDGPVIYRPTTEEVDGKLVPTVAAFRKYDSLYDALADRYSVLTNERYKGIIGADPFTGADILQQAGYATDSQYADKLKSIIKSNNLTQYDVGGKSPSSGGVNVTVPGGTGGSGSGGNGYYYDPPKGGSGGTNWKPGDPIYVTVPDYIANPGNVIEDVFGDPIADGPDWKDKARDRFDQLNPPSELPEIISDIGESIGGFASKLATGAATVVVIVVLIVLLVVILITMAKGEVMPNG